MKGNIKERLQNINALVVGILPCQKNLIRLMKFVPVCYWEIDSLQAKDPDFEGGANKESLNTAKVNFRKYGAKSKEDILNVRKPLSVEIPKDIL
jgi:hypothetical protein